MVGTARCSTILSQQFSDRRVHTSVLKINKKKTQEEEEEEEEEEEKKRRR